MATLNDFSENQITKLFILKVKCGISRQQFYCQCSSIIDQISSENKMQNVINKTGDEVFVS